MKRIRTNGSGERTQPGGTTNLLGHPGGVAFPWRPLESARHHHGTPVRRMGLCRCRDLARMTRQPDGRAGLLHHQVMRSASRSIRAISARPRSSCRSAIRPRRSRSSVGAWSLRCANLSAKWSRPTCWRCAARRSDATAAKFRPMKMGEGPFGLTGKRVWVAGHRRMSAAQLSATLPPRVAKSSPPAATSST